MLMRAVFWNQKSHGIRHASLVAGLKESPAVLIPVIMAINVSDSRIQPTAATRDSGTNFSELSALVRLGTMTPRNVLTPGMNLGGVTIIRLIAEGGMGSVYEAVQEKPRRTVAVKAIRAGVVSQVLIKRFEYETQVLARLTHPGIAQIFMVGTTDLGGVDVPYFVMEYIPHAQSLTTYADSQKLSTHERVTLFRRVCEAAAYGHRKGIIHRDLKPGNILVDATGQPKIIDFGVARSIDSDIALTTMHTDVGQLIGTLQYMCPEQFDADPNDIDVRADVYALGVVLYELLAGRPPYETHKKSVFEVARVVREVDPTPLSTVNRTLRRDIATIAGKCLEKDRERRYSSAAELESDLGRYLSGEPIAASPQSFIAALLRLARRHRAAAAAATSVLMAVGLALVGISFFAVRAASERAGAIEERNRAHASEQKAVQHAENAEKQRLTAIRESERARQQELVAQQERDRVKAVLGFFLQTFRTADPFHGARDIKVADVLEPAVGAATEQFKDDPVALADVLLSIGQTLFTLGRDQSAAAALKQAADTLDAAPSDGGDADRLRVAEALNSLALVYRRQRRYADAQPLLERALVIREKAFGLQHEATVGTLTNLAGLSHELGDNDRAERLHTQVLEIKKQMHGLEHPSTASSLCFLGHLYQAQRKFPEAEAHLQQSLEIRKRVLGPEHPWIAENLLHLATVMAYQPQRRAEAEPRLARALEISEKHLGPDHPLTAEILSNYVRIGQTFKNDDEAVAFQERSLAIVEQIVGPSHSGVATLLRGLAGAYRRMGRTADADRCLQRLDAIEAKAATDDRPPLPPRAPPAHRS